MLYFVQIKTSSFAFHSYIHCIQFVCVNQLARTGTACAPNACAPNKK